MFEIVIDSKFTKSFKKFDNKLQQKILKYLNQSTILENPRRLGKPLLREKKGLWRYRIEYYRVICQIIDNELVILVVDVDKRSDVYK